MSKEKSSYNWQRECIQLRALNKDILYENEELKEKITKLRKENNDIKSILNAINIISKTGDENEY